MTNMFRRSDPQPAAVVPPPAAAPTPAPPPTMPDPLSPETLEARRKAMTAQRAGRQSTILTTTANRVAEPLAAGGTYSGRTLG